MAEYYLNSSCRFRRQQWALGHVGDQGGSLAQSSPRAVAPAIFPCYVTLMRQNQAKLKRGVRSSPTLGFEPAWFQATQGQRFKPGHDHRSTGVTTLPDRRR